jgi:aconitate decarboxylase
MLNGAFIQACELDDFHSVAPLHSASILLPTLIAAAEYESHHESNPRPANGASFLLACIVGFEVGPRAGMALNGGEVLALGWHCGPIFGHPASAAAASKLFALPPESIEDAIGMACTQSCGLMAAQYEGMIKRMQHAFAARNGLFSALLARSGYVGIKKVFERPYGGYLSMFSLGSDKDPRYQEREVVKDLGFYWHTMVIRTKLYACVGGAHGLIEAITALQTRHPAQMNNLATMKRMTIRLSRPVFAHCGWSVTERPMTATGSQMNCAYVAAVQLVERQVLLAQFATRALDSDEVWALIPRIVCEHGPEFDIPARGCGAHVQMHFEDRTVLEEILDRPRGFDPPLSNEEIRQKWRGLTDDIMEAGRRDRIENAVLGLEGLKDIEDLAKELAGPVSNPLA